MAKEGSSMKKIIHFLIPMLSLLWFSLNGVSPLYAASHTQYYATASPLPHRSWLSFSTEITPTDEVITVTGIILLQGRTDNKDVEIYLNNDTCETAVLETALARTDSEGKFLAELPISQTFQCLQAKKEGYLIGQWPTPQGDIGTMILLGGDVNADNLINIFDLALIAAKYDSSDPTVDVNGDNLVDIFDLTISAINYNKRGPIQ
jgi:hypothetical protein